MQVFVLELGCLILEGLQYKTKTMIEKLVTILAQDQRFRLKIQQNQQPRAASVCRIFVTKDFAKLSKKPSQAVLEF